MTPRDVNGLQVFEGDRVSLAGVYGTVVLANGRVIDVRPDKQPGGFEIIGHLDARVLEKVTDAETV